MSRRSKKKIRKAKVGGGGGVEASGAAVADHSNNGAGSRTDRPATGRTAWFVSIFVVGVIGVVWIAPQLARKPANNAPAIPVRHPPLPQLNNYDSEKLEPQIREQLSTAIKLVQAMPLDADAVGQLGMLYQIYDFTELAKACYRRVISLSPYDPSWHYYMGMLCAQANDTKEAVAHFNAFLTKRPEDIPALWRRAATHLADEELTKALNGFQKIIELDSSNPHAQLGAARAQIRRARYSEAEKFARKAVELAPDYGRAHEQLAIALNEQGRKAEAKPHERMALQYAESAPAVDDPLAERLERLGLGGVHGLQKGIDLLNQRRFSVAARAFRSVLEKNPTLAEAHMNLGTALMNIGQFNDAIRHFRRTIELKPKSPKAFYNLGLIYHAKEEFVDAVHEFNQALRNDPNYFEAHLGLAMDLPNVGEIRLAAEHFEKASELRPNDPRPYKGLVTVLTYLQEFDKVVQTLKQGADRLPNDPSMVERLAWTLATCPDDGIRNPDEALRLAERACQATNYQNARFLDTLAAAHAANGNFSEAARICQDVIHMALGINDTLLATEVASRLTLYQAEKPYIIPPPEPRVEVRELNK